MKKSHFLLFIVMLIMVTIFLISCEKDSEELRRPFKMTSDTWYRFSPAAPASVTANGTTFTSFAYVPGGGTGTATDMGTITTFFNQLAYTDNPNVPQPTPLGTVSASVSLLNSFPVTGAPLPLVQSGDFGTLSTADVWLKTPATDAAGNIINAVIFNSEGDAIFTSPTSPSVITPVSATRLNFAGTLKIVGGRGKFANATGEVTFNGFFNPQNPNNAGYGFDGWIQY